MYTILVEDIKKLINCGYTMFAPLSLTNEENIAWGQIGQPVTMTYSNCLHIWSACVSCLSSSTLPVERTSTVLKSLSCPRTFEHHACLLGLT